MKKASHRQENDCLNCGHIVEDKFCPKCGQENLVTKEDAFHMVSHAIADYFHFEHKFFSTLKPLLLIPGQLTKEYISGKRVSFIHPIRLYIFVSIVFFLVLLKEDKSKKLQTEEYKIEALKTAQKSKKDNIWTLISDNPERKADTTIEAYENRQAKLPENKKDSFFKHHFSKKIIEINADPDPIKKIIEGVLHNIPKMMFILLPLFAIILKLVYIRKDKYYYEHLIFAFHFHSAIFIAILLAIFFNWSIGFYTDISDFINTLATFYVIWYIYRSLRTFYNSSRWITVTKIFFLSFTYAILLTISFLLVAFVTILL